MESRARVLAAAVGLAAAACLACLAAVDLTTKGATATALAWIPVIQPHFLVRMPTRRGLTVPLAVLLHDAALDPLYNEGEPIVDYKWVGNNAAGYDPEAQNVWASLPLTKADIKAAEEEFRGMAPKSLAHSCDKTGTCVPEVNAWDFLPDSEAKTLKVMIVTAFNCVVVIDLDGTDKFILIQTHVEGAPPVNVWAEMPLDY